MWMGWRIALQRQLNESNSKMVSAMQHNLLLWFFTTSTTKLTHRLHLRMGARFRLGSDTLVIRTKTKQTNVHGVNRRCNWGACSHAVYPVDSACRAFRGAELVSRKKPENLVAHAALDGIAPGVCVYIGRLSVFTCFFFFSTLIEDLWSGEKTCALFRSFLRLSFVTVEQVVIFVAYAT